VSRNEFGNERHKIWARNFFLRVFFSSHLRTAVGADGVIGVLMPGGNDGLIRVLICISDALGVTAGGSWVGGAGAAILKHEKNSS
jgi:hypothetical protein